MKFIGNDKAVSFLQKSLEKDNVNHAYIFSGPENVGKFTLAKLFALAAVLRAKEINLDVEYKDKDANLDLIIVEPEIIEKKGVIKKRDIKIEDIRDAKQNLSLYPYSGKYKFLIINDAQKMTVAAQNSILKTLEEPNPTSIIVLVTNEIDRILPTIQSRCQVVNFSLVEVEQIEKQFLLGNQEANLTMGRPGLAKLIGEDAEEKNFRIETFKKLNLVLESSIKEKFAIAEEYSKDLPKALIALQIWISILRNQGKFQIIEKIQNTLELLKSTNANTKLILESLFVEL